MKRRILPALALAAVTAVTAAPAMAAARETEAPSRERLAQSWEDYGRDVRGWFGRWWDRLSSSRPQGERPLISIMLRNREKLGLSEDQVRHLEQLRTDYQKESIRRDADIRVAEMDLDQLLDAPNIDMPKVEAKIREIEKLRGDLRLARIRAIQKGKQQLTADQRKKLQQILNDSESSPPRRPEHEE